MKYDVVVTAGITRKEFASLVGVSEVMAWKWVAGQAKPRETYNGKPLRRRVEVLLLTLQKLVDKGQLPKNDLRVNRYSDPEIRGRREKIINQIRSFLDAQVATAPANE